MKKIIFILVLLFSTDVCFGQTPCVVPNPTQCNTVINGSLVLGPLCTANFGNVVIPVSAGGTGVSILPSNGKVLMSNGTSYTPVDFGVLYLPKSDTNTVVMTRHDADSAIAVMQTSIAGKISTEVDPTVPSYSKSLTAFSVIKTSTDALYATIAQVNAKFTTPTGTTSQYLRGDGTLATFPTIPTTKKQETYSGTTIAAGTYTIAFPVAYSVAPNIQANIINATDSQNIRTTSITTTGFTVVVRNRVDVIGLLPTWVNVSGAIVDVLITEK